MPTPSPIVTYDQKCEPFGVSRGSISGNEAAAGACAPAATNGIIRATARRARAPRRNQLTPRTSSGGKLGGETGETRLVTIGGLLLDDALRHGPVQDRY